MAWLAAQTPGFVVPPYVPPCGDSSHASPAGAGDDSGDTGEDHQRSDRSGINATSTGLTLADVAAYKAAQAVLAGGNAT